MMAASARVDDLRTVLRLEPTGEACFVANVPDGWQQGRGAFGGLVLGLLAKAMEQCEPDRGRALRTLSGELLAPVLPGPAEITVELLRRGSGLSSLAARLRQGGELLAHASAILAKSRVADREALTLTAPSLRPWQEVEVLPLRPPLGPDFAQWFEHRSTGPLPFSGGAPLAEGWIRAKHGVERFGAPELIAYADAWWPTTYAAETAPRPMATVAFLFQLCVDPTTLDPAAPLIYRARTQAAHDGYVAELRELWSPEGRLIALNPQTFAIIR